MEEVVNKLRKNKQTIATMESCTGGAVANAITNIEGASDIFRFGAVTYATASKIKMGVSQDIIEKYSVYSMETANEMSRNISLFAQSDYGVGITGKLLRADKNNLFGEDDITYISIYRKRNNDYINSIVQATENTREKNKEKIVKEIQVLLQKELS